MTQTIDTNVLPYASNTHAAENERARGRPEHLSGGASLVVLLWPTVLDYLRTATHPAIWSRDRDLRKFDGIAVQDPYADRFASGLS